VSKYYSRRRGEGAQAARSAGRGVVKNVKFILIIMIMNTEQETSPEGQGQGRDAEKPPKRRAAAQAGGSRTVPAVPDVGAVSVEAVVVENVIILTTDGHGLQTRIRCP